MFGKYEGNGAMLAHLLPPHPGTYALLSRPTKDVLVSVGRLGTFRLGAGLFVYVGSALGAGGVRARVAHHLRDKRRARWHIDALTQQCPAEAICWVTGLERLECLYLSTEKGTT
jgi:Uri superfamily endonuclease